MKCDIIIPVWNQPDHTRDCIESLIKNTKYPYRLILVDNASEAETCDYLKGLLDRKALDVKLIKNESNLGFVKAVNQGLKISDAPYVCILNNDTIPAPGWLEEMIEFAELHKDVGLINPQCNGHLDTPIETHAGNLAAKNKNVYMEMNQCFGFCMLIKRDVINKIGYMDERFGIGGFDDTDYSMRAGLAGYRCVALHSAYVYHKEHVSFEAMGDHKAIVSKGEGEYFKKWPRHLRIAVAIAMNDSDKDVEVENVLKSILFLARKWCWVNLWIFGNEEMNKERVEDVSARIDIPLHQNIKYNFIPGRFKNVHVLIRIFERLIGTKRRKKYDAILTNDKNIMSLLKISSAVHRIKICFDEFRSETSHRLNNLITELRNI